MCIYIYIHTYYHCVFLCIVSCVLCCLIRAEALYFSGTPGTPICLPSKFRARRSLEAAEDHNNNNNDDNIIIMIINHKYNTTIIKCGSMIIYSHNNKRIPLEGAEGAVLIAVLSLCFGWFAFKDTVLRVLSRHPLIRGIAKRLNSFKNINSRNDMFESRNLL